MMFLTYPEDSLTIIEEGVRLCKKLNEKKSLAKIYGLLGIYYSHRGKPVKAIKYSEIGFERPYELEDLDLMAPIARSLCVSYLAAGEFQKVSNFAPEMISLIETANRETDLFGSPFHTYSLLCAYYALSNSFLGNFDEARIFFDKGLKAASSIAHFASLGVAKAMFGLMFITRGDGANAIQHFNDSIRYFEKSKTPLIFGVSWSGFGSGYYFLGDMETAINHLHKGIELTDSGGSEWWKAFPYLFLGKSQYHLGDKRESLHTIEKALKISQKNNENHHEGASWILLGKIIGETDPSQSKKTLEHILKGIKILDQLKIKPFSAEGHLYLGELYLGIGDRENAASNLRKAELMFREMGMDYWHNRTQETIDKM